MSEWLLQALLSPLNEILLTRSGSWIQVTNTAPRNLFLDQQCRGHLRFIKFFPSKIVENVWDLTQGRERSQIRKKQRTIKAMHHLRFYKDLLVKLSDRVGWVKSVCEHVGYFHETFYADAPSAHVNWHLAQVVEIYGQQKFQGCKTVLESNVFGNQIFWCSLCRFSHAAVLTILESVVAPTRHVWYDLSANVKAVRVSCMLFVYNRRTRAVKILSPHLRLFGKKNKAQLTELDGFDRFLSSFQTNIEFNAVPSLSHLSALRVARVIVDCDIESCRSSAEFSEEFVNECTDITHTREIDFRPHVADFAAKQIIERANFLHFDRFRPLF